MFFNQIADQSDHIFLCHDLNPTQLV